MVTGPYSCSCCSFHVKENSAWDCPLQDASLLMVCWTNSPGHEISHITLVIRYYISLSPNLQEKENDIIQSRFIVKGREQEEEVALTMYIHMNKYF
jgi:hypothetical protein